ncbi:hypothetical protein GCM10009827_115120 [Dactylosporangium maewongense]|uniref:Uncharacterized protein n=1 Tax=Dactylosporangium maewongense TaxID=634393 RepID=A0ABN2DDY1_9ACTN
MIELEQLDLTDDERAALDGDREALTALANRLADVATPSGPTPNDLGNGTAFIPLTAPARQPPGGPSVTGAPRTESWTPRAADLHGAPLLPFNQSPAGAQALC